MKTRSLMLIVFITALGLISPYLLGHYDNFRGVIFALLLIAIYAILLKTSFYRRSYVATLGLSASFSSGLINFFAWIVKVVWPQGETEISAGTLFFLMLLSTILSIYFLIKYFKVRKGHWSLLGILTDLMTFFLTIPIMIQIYVLLLNHTLL